MGRVVLLTGVSGDLGVRLARLLQSDPDVERVIGVDVVAPPLDLGRTEFVRADIRNPIVAKVIGQAGVDTVVHMPATPGTGARTAAEKTNVTGTMQLLAACQQAASVRKLVVRSSSVVYGSSARDPAMFTEDAEPSRLPRSGWGRDCVELEGYVRGFARRRPDVDVTLLRLADILGPRLRTPLGAYFSLPVIPTVLGYDARLQLLHEHDALAVLRRAATGGLPGTYNVAGEGVLMLSQAVRRLSRPGVPVLPLAAALVRPVLRRMGGVDFSAEQVRFLCHGRVMDTARLRLRFSYAPAYTTAGALEDFIASRALAAPTADAVVAPRPGRTPVDIVDRARPRRG